MADLTQYTGGEGVKSAPDEGGGGDYSPLPAGWYPVSIESAEVKPTKAGTGNYIKLKMKVLSGNGANRVIFPMLTLKNPNAKAEEVGRRQLGALGDACGIPVIGDTDQLLGQNLDVRLKVKPARGDYAADNDVVSYARLGTKSGGQAPSANVPSYGHPPAAQAPAAKGKMPWE